jgi:hypothetical protein
MDAVESDPFLVTFLFKRLSLPVPQIRNLTLVADESHNCRSSADISQLDHWPAGSGIAQDSYLKLISFAFYGSRLTLLVCL